ncbi:hypothetical protein [Burkholderia gladioli]|uniref:hypothetical protein n=1 Tax=Burkholderia gladioli TaxID=28095 RepID=UPI0011B238D9|nr:hypothetical protein [Burkholderia gladioli]
MIKIYVFFVLFLQSVANAQVAPDLVLSSTATRGWLLSPQRDARVYYPMWRHNLNTLESSKEHATEVDRGILGGMSQERPASTQYRSVNVPSATALPLEDLSTSSRKLLEQYHRFKSLR